MVDDALLHRLDRLTLLLLAAVALLGGLVFGRDYGGRILYSLVGFFVVGMVLLIVGALRG